MTANELKRISNKLTDKDVLSYRLREDGFLIVVNKQGWKVTFSPAEVEKAHQSSQRKARAANG